MLRLAQEEQLTRPFVQSQMVYACVQVRARAIAAIPHQWWKTREMEDVLDLKSRDGDALLRVMERPNPLLSQRQFWRALEVFYCLAGGAFLFMNRAREGKMIPMEPGDLPDEIWPIREDLVAPRFLEKNGSQLPDAWAFDTVKGEVVYPAHAVAHLYDPDPYNIVRGVGPLQAAHRRANVSFKLEAFDDALVANGGQVGGVLTHDGSALGTDQINQLEKSWREEHDKPAGHGKTAVLPGGIKFTATAMTPREMDFAKLREWNRDEIMMAFGVTKTLLGITDDVNRANAHEARRVFYESTITPQTEFWSDQVMGTFLAMLPEPQRKWGHSFNLSAVPALREDIDSVLDRVQKLTNMGRSFREAARLVGWKADLEGMEGVDDRYLPNTISLAPAEESGDEKTAAPAMSLNGAQVTSMLQIVKDVATGVVPKASAEEMLTTAFPIDSGRAKKILASVKEGSVDPAAIKEAEDEIRKDEKDEAGMPFQVFASGLTRGERIKKSLDFDALLRPFDDKVARAVRKTFRGMVLAQRAKLREIAKSGGKGFDDLSEPRVWECLIRETDEYGHFLPGVDPEWLQVCGATDSEIERLLAINKEKFGKELWGNTHGALEDLIARAAEDLASELGVTAFPTATDPAMLEFLAEKELLLKETVGTFREQIKNALVRGMSGKLDGATLADRVREALQKLEGEMKVMMDRVGVRAELIARTETASAANASRVRQMEEAEIEEHEWLSSKDDLVRTLPTSHRIDGEVAKVGERFSNGLHYPGDPNQPFGAGAVASCRCETLPVIPRE